METNTKKKGNIREILTLSFAICAYLIGSGFATGQELLQYFASYGFLGIGAVAVAFFMLAFMLIAFFRLGKEKNITNAHDVFVYYCGSKIGTFFEIVAFMYLIVQPVVYYTGVGATTNEAFGTPPIVGAAILGTLVIITVLLGLKKLVDIIGNVGILIIISVVVLSIIHLSTTFGQVSAGSALIQQLNILQPSSSWIVSGFLYATFNVLGMAAIMPLIGNQTTEQKNNTKGALLGSLIFCLTVTLILLSFLGDAAGVSDKQVPMLYIMQKLFPKLAPAFSLVILAGVYTSCTPMFWNFCTRVMDEKSPKFKIFVIVLGALTVFIGTRFTLDKVINVFYRISGYMGAIFFILMIIKELRTHISKNK